MRITSLLFLLILAAAAKAQESADTLRHDAIVITSSRLEERTSATGRNLSSIEGFQFDELPVTSVDELLRYIPGLEAQARGAFGVQSDLSLRGSTYNQVLVLVDGVRINDPLTGHFNSYIPISPQEIERIEVLRGPASSIYGSEAVGGVIHIITKTNAQTREPANSANIEASAGNFGLFLLKTGATFTKDNWTFSGGYDGSFSDGHQIQGDTRSDFNLQNASAGVGYDFGNWKLGLRAGYSFRDFSARYFYTRSTFDKSRESVDNLWTTMQLFKQGEFSTSEISLSFKNTNDTFVFSPDFPSTNTHNTKFYMLQYNGSLRKERWSFAYGVQVDQRAITSNDRGDHNDLHSAVYGLAKYGLQNTSLQTSLRVDYDANYNVEATPQVAVSHALGKVILQGSAGRGIRAGDYTERFVSTNIEGPLTPGRNLGNPDLKAETSWSYEIGMQYLPRPGIRLVATVFSRDSKNLIDYVVTNSNDITNNGNLVPDADYFYAQNIADVVTSGLELEVWGFRQISSSSRVQLDLGYIHLNSSAPGGAITKYLSNHADHLFTGNIIYSFNAFTVSLNGISKVRTEDEAPAINANLARSYLVINGRLMYETRARVYVFGEVRNVFDVDYADVLGAEMPGRWTFGGIGWRL